MTGGRPLEILAYLHSFDPGGVERTALRLCADWQAQGARVKVLMGRSTGVTRASAPPLNYIVYPSGVVRTAPFETLWMIHCLWKRVRAARPDVIFCAGNSYTVVAVALRLLLGRACPPIVAKISNALDRKDMPRLGRPFYRLWLRLQGRLIDHMVAIAPALRAEIVTLMRMPPNRVAAIADPAIGEREAVRLQACRARTPRHPGERLFLAVGRLAHQKRFDLLIAAFAQGCRPGDRLAIVGEGPKRAGLERQIARLGLTGRVMLAGHCGDLAPWFAQADCFVLSSDYEGLPAVLVEALVAGLPVISTRSSAGVAALLDQGLGRLVDPGDQDGLATALAADVPPQDVTAARARAMPFRVEQAGPAWLDLLRRAARPVVSQMRQSSDQAVSGR